MSTEVLKALANPLRREVWNQVTRMRFVRAVDLAATLDLPANTLSFHLRTLAKAGLIEEAPERARDKRDRVWKPTKGALSPGSPDSPVADPALGALVLDGYVADNRDLVARVAQWAPRYVSGEDAAERGTLATFTLRLTRQHFVELIERVNTVVDEYREGDDGQDAHTWQVAIVAASDEI